MDIIGMAVVNWTTAGGATLEELQSLGGGAGVAVVWMDGTRGGKVKGAAVVIPAWRLSSSSRSIISFKARGLEMVVDEEIGNDVVVVVRAVVVVGREVVVGRLVVVVEDLGVVVVVDRVVVGGLLAKSRAGLLVVGLVDVVVGAVVVLSKRRMTLSFVPDQVIDGVLV